MRSVTKNLRKKLCTYNYEEKYFLLGTLEIEEHFNFFLGFNYIPIREYQNSCTDTLLLLICKDLLRCRGFKRIELDEELRITC